LAELRCGPCFLVTEQNALCYAASEKKGFPVYPKNIQYGDVIKGLPVPSQSAQAVYCSHVLEHMALEELRITLRNVFGYLRPGGTFRLVVPDLEQLIKTYVADPAAGASSRFMQDSYLGEKNVTRGLKAMPTALFGRARHLWMWDYKGMTEELEAAGFTSVRRAQFGDSGDPRFKSVESEGRWTNCLGIECKHP
jgi:hypothetical protein